MIIHQVVDEKLTPMQSPSGRWKVDTHAVTKCAGAMFKIIEATGKLCDVTGLNPALQSKQQQLPMTIANDKHTLWPFHKVYSLEEKLENLRMA